MTGKAMACMMAGAVFSLFGCSAEDRTSAAEVTGGTGRDSDRVLLLQRQHPVRGGADSEGDRRRTFRNQAGHAVSGRL